jgi:hypothetical protein
LLRWTEGVPLFTIEEPDAPPHDNRSAQTKRGMAAKGCKGGRGNRREQPPSVAETTPADRSLADDGLTPHERKRRRERWLPVVLDLHAQGESVASIERRLRSVAGRRVTTQMTISNWTKKANRILCRG